MNKDRYDFGNNWYDFIKEIDQKQINTATEHLERLVGNINGKTFLDIGSGSGLHSLAALKLGASSVTAIDYDPISVKASTSLLSEYAKGGSWEVTKGDILADSLETRRFDVVYSWGVLHHTGDMWTAIQNASKLCRKDGIFALALYIKTPFCELWKKEKRIYAKHKTIRPILDALFIALLFARKSFSGTNPFTYISEYNSNRGMNFFTDVRDWLGGYPYESISDEELDSFMTTQGFSLVRKNNTAPGKGLFGTGCGEWVYQKR